MELYTRNLIQTIAIQKAQIVNFFLKSYLEIIVLRISRTPSNGMLESRRPPPLSLYKYRPSPQCRQLILVLVTIKSSTHSLWSIMALITTADQ